MTRRGNSSSSWEGAPSIDDVQEAARESLARVWSNRTLVGIALGVVVVGAAYRAGRTKAAELVLPTCVEIYSDSLAAYLEAARDGRLSPEIIDRLIADLDAVKAESYNGAITIELSSEQSERSSRSWPVTRGNSPN